MKKLKKNFFLGKRSSIHFIEKRESEEKKDSDYRHNKKNSCVDKKDMLRCMIAVDKNVNFQNKSSLLSDNYKNKTNQYCCNFSEKSNLKIKPNQMFQQDKIFHANENITFPIKNEPFYNLKILIKLIFLDDSSIPESVNLDDQEIKILRIILKKKRITTKPLSQNLTKKTIEKILKSTSSKKRETYLKYIFAKCIKHLKKKFIKNLILSKKTS